MHCGSNEREWLLLANAHLCDGCTCVARSFTWEVRAVCYERAVIGTAVRRRRAKDHVGVACGRKESDGRERKDGHD